MNVLDQIALIRRERATASARARLDDLARVLDGLNVMDALETLRRRRFSPNLCYGPKAFSGLTPAPWVSALIWHRPAGYFGYRTLTLLGVWAIDQASETVITVGTKTRPYNAPFYEAEAYHKLIRQGFDLYYEENGSPPPESGRCMTATYTADQRLALRDAVTQALNACE